MATMLEPHLQVSKYDRSLAEAIGAGVVPKPPLMHWNKWQEWRTKHGRRPHMATDGHSTGNDQERQLYLEIMRQLYGESWKDQLEPERASTAGGASSTAAAATPAPSATAVQSGIGDGTLVIPASLPEASIPGSGSGSLSSFRSSNPPTPNTLTRSARSEYNQGHGKKVIRQMGTG